MALVKKKRKLEQGNESLAGDGTQEEASTSRFDRFENMLQEQGQAQHRLEQVQQEQGQAQHRLENIVQEAQHRLENIVQEVQQEVVALRQAKTGKGATTYAQFYQSLLEEKLVRKISADVAGFLCLQEIVSLPSTVNPVTPEIGTKEVDVQKEFERCLALLRDYETVSSRMASVPRENAYKYVSFATRRPDIVIQKKKHTGSTSIVFFGDCKKRGSGDFSDEEIGHVLDMGRVFMEKVGYYRQKLVVFLTDGMRWQFFEVKRGGERICYTESKIIDNTEKGWNIFWTLLQLDAVGLGHREPQIEGVILRQALGRGSSASVYEGVWHSDKVLVKVYKKDWESSFQAEQAALTTLKNTEGIPRIQATVSVANSETLDCYAEALVVSPVGHPIKTDVTREGGLVDGSHLKRLVEIVQEAHNKGLVHRDIKPDNIFLTDSNQILLNDWGSSARSSETQTLWEGTRGFSVSEEQQRTTYWSKETCDLVALIRTSYVLLFKESPPIDSDQAAVVFWANRFRFGTVWSQAMECAVSKNYDGFGDLLFSLK